jgi:hypothetical protein
MKTKKIKFSDIDTRKSQLIFDVSEDELRQNLLRYNIEKNAIKNNIENMLFSSFLVI